VVRAHQSVFDTDLAGDEVDQAAVDKVRADAARPFFGQHQAFAFDAWQAADPRPNGATGTQPHRFGHVGQAGILDRLPGRIDPVDDERVNLPLDLVINPLVRVESVFVIGRLDLAGDAALLVRRVKVGDGAGTALGGQNIRPSRFDVAAKRRDEPQSCDHYTAHCLLHPFKCKRPPAIREAVRAALAGVMQGGQSASISPCSGR
jgi:hypothetical protein